jgi:hypothetical protein
MTKSVYRCEGEHHSGRKCNNSCVVITLSNYPPINCLLFTEGYGLTKPKWIKQGEVQ